MKMKDFNDEILRSYIAQGYKYILYYCMEHFAILTPCLEEQETNEDSYVLLITSEEVMAMAKGDDFPFYVLQ